MNGDQPPQDEYIRLLREAYVFIGMEHNISIPWPNELLKWKQTVESITGWDHYEETHRYRKMLEQNQVDQNQLT